jgi:hypothetical protein
MIKNNGYMNDLKRYYRLKPTGNCWAERIGEEVKLLFKRFDNETGKELDPEYQYSTVEQLKKDKEDLENQLFAINSILEDINK